MAKRQERLAAEEVKRAKIAADYPIPHANCAEIIESLVNAKYLPSGNGSIWAQEIRVFKMLMKKGYNEEAFWRGFNPGFQVRSMLYWYNVGAKELEKAWRFYQYEKAQNQRMQEMNSKQEEQNTLDRAENLDTIVVDGGKPKKAKNALEWADS